MLTLIKNLVDQLNYHRYLYYELAAPIISDQAYDTLYDRYQKYKKDAPEIFELNPNLEIGVGYDPVSNIHKKIQHQIPMKSLDKGHTIEDCLSEFKKWQASHTSLNIHTAFSIMVQPKIDGLSLSLTYDNGILLRAVTRGNGYEGDDVTHHAVNISGIPQEIPFKQPVEIRGEVYIPKSVFLEVLERFPESNFKNERNTAAGALRNKESSGSAGKGLHFMAYDVFSYLHSDSSTYCYYSELTNKIWQMGFEIPFQILTEGTETLSKTLEDIKNYNDTIADFATDGAVIKVDCLATRKKLGNNTNWPNWALAYKFEDKKAVTKLIDVEWAVGKSGTIAPTAIMEPIDLEGVTIKRASLCNLDEINRLNIKIGSQIVIKRSNEVIPKILEVIDNTDTTDIKIPEHCPGCFGKLEIDGPRLMCYNSSCKDQIVGKIVHATKVLEVDNLGEKQIEKLVNLGHLKNCFDLFNLTKDQLLEMDKVKDKSAERFLKSIEIAKGKITTDRVLEACNIPNLGSRAEKLLEYYSIEQIPNLNPENLSMIDGFGDIISNNILNWFKNESNINLFNNFVQFLKDNNKLERKEKVMSGDKLGGLNFVITGTLPNLKREDAASIIISNGGIVQGAVSKMTNYLVLGEKAGSKLKKAQSLNIPTLSEQELLDMVN